MPGRKGYVIAAFVLIAGIAAAATFVVLQLRDLGAGVRQVVVPGVAELALEDVGGYTIFHETGATVDGRYYASNDVAGLAVTVTDSDGRPVDVRTLGVTTSYEFGGRKGRSILAFDVERPGTYLLSAEHPGGEGNDVVAFGAAGIALAIAVTTFLRRYQAKRRMAPSAQDQ